MLAQPVSPPELRPISVVDYHRMAEVGILAADERVELIAGQILQKMPKGPAHSALCKRLEKLLEGRLGDRALVRLLDPVRLDVFSEPEPDLAIAKAREDFYAVGHPTPADVYWLVEIADTSASRDLGTKAMLYGTAAIPEYWVLAIATQELHVFRDPQPNAGYQCQMILRGQQEVAPQAFPHRQFSIAACFGRS